jgi:NTE family protein
MSEMANNPQPSGPDLPLSLEALSLRQHELGAPRLQKIELGAGEVLFEQGDEGDSVYQIQAGMLGVRVRESDGTESVIARLAPGALVGEMALLTGQPRTATVFAINSTGLLRLSKAEFEKLDPGDQRRLFDPQTTLIPRWQQLQLAHVLQSLLGKLEVAELHHLRRQMEWMHLSNGDILFRQGDPADGMYLVINGRLQFVTRNERGEEQISGLIGPGETFGEFALISEAPRTASVHAIRETDAVRISRQVFESLVRDHPELMGKMTRIIIERHQAALRPKAHSARTFTVTILPASPNVPASSFARLLAEALEKFGTSTAVTCLDFDSIYGQEGVSQLPMETTSNPAIVTQMSDLEANHDYVLLAADYEPTPWTRRCFGQSDRVLVLARPGDDPEPSEAERMLDGLDVPPRKELVLWHPEGTEQPHGTAAWLDARQVRTHYHIRQADPAHLDRLVRRLTGHAVALVLSTGGARGFAHLGAHRALEELGIPIDYVGTASMGAVIGGYLYVHKNNAELMQAASQFADPRALFDRTLPFTALMDSKKVTRFVQTVFGDRRIEDLWYPFFCVATNLTRAEAMVMERGLLWRAVRASLAIPGVFTPVMEDGEVIVDGGIMDNFPVRLMSERTESDRIIGIHVNPLARDKRYYEFDTDISGWRVLANRLNPFSKNLDLPSRTGIIMRTMEINSARQTREQEGLADLLIKPDVKKYSSNDYAAYREIAQAGYEAALDALWGWKAGKPDLE